MNAPAIVFAPVSFSFAEQTLFQDQSYSFAAGKRAFLVGPGGCEKVSAPDSWTVELP